MKYIDHEKANAAKSGISSEEETHVKQKSKSTNFSD